MAFYAIICAWVGEKDLALAQLETVTRMPCYLSYGQLRLQPYWDPLREDPRFEKIVALLEPKETDTYSKWDSLVFRCATDWAAVEIIAAEFVSALQTRRATRFAPLPQKLQSISDRRSPHHPAYLLTGNFF
jgi:hypothetical protein